MYEIEKIAYIYIYKTPGYFVYLMRDDKINLVKSLAG